MQKVADDAGAAEVLTALSHAHRRQLDAAATILELAADWADLHPALDGESAAYVVDRCTGARLPIAGDGTPGVDTLASVEFAAVLGCSTASGLQLLGDVLELRHRLPGVWAAALRGAVPAWRARLVAQATRSLSREAAAFVDRQVGAAAGAVGSTRLARLVAAAVAEFMPEQAERERIEAAEHRRFDIDLDVAVDGLASVSGRLDVADALELEAAIADRAAQLGREGWSESLDVRRSLAAGDLARSQETFDYRPAALETPGYVDRSDRGDVDRSDADGSDADGSDAGSAHGSQPKRRPRGREVVLYVHLSAEALTGPAGIARLQNLDRPVLSGVVRDWCGKPDARIVVKPVIDLRDPVSVDSYEVPDRIAERIALRDRHCVFPWCDNQRGDADHVVPFGRGGPTSTDNLALLCRRHHRAKTHSRWRYRIIRPGRYLWTSPHGHRWIRDRDGTRRLE